MTPDELFDSIIQAFARDPRVTKSKMFGSPGLKVSGKVFACLVKGKLVVKLPQDRVNALVTSGEAERFDPGMGRLMKEWVAVVPSGEEEWFTLVRESRDFVASAL